MNLTDTHTHLYLKEFDADREALMAQAVSLGVDKFFLPNIDRASVEPMMDLANRYPNRCFPMLGLHPTAVNENYHEALSFLHDMLNAYRFYAIGEIGIDLHWDKTFFVQQQEAFKMQIDWAVQQDLPVVIHTRNSFDETYAIVREVKQDIKAGKILRGIFHCFSGTLEQAKKIIALGGFKLGIGGVVTFKNSGLADVVKQVDMQHIVLETDAPYLAPVPFRGKRNEPAWLLNIAQKLASVKNISIEEVAAVTSANSREVFGI